MIFVFIGFFLPISNIAYAFSEGDQYVCGFDRILRFYENKEPYFTESYSNQSPFSFVVQSNKIKMGENWFIGSTLPIIDISKKFLTASDGTDLVKLREESGKIIGYAGTLDSYIKMFYVRCRQL